MSNEEEGSGGGMSDHLKRYQTYINSLKSGKSSGISAAFGRAADILPPEALEIKAPLNSKAGTPIGPPPMFSKAGSADPAVATAAPELKQAEARTPPALDEQVLDLEADKEFLRRSVEEMVASCAAALDDPVGARVLTDEGEQEVISVYLENGERMFLLSDLSMIGERDFLTRLVTDVQNASTPEVHKPAPATNEPSPPQVPVLKQETSQAQAAKEPSVQFQQIQPELSANQPTLEVKNPSGTLLWHVYYGERDVSLISMSDGGLIKRAEGRKEYVFSTLSQIDGDIKLYILSGLLVDPNTGNIYIEVNEGAYTAAFLNNGWRIHQYRRHEGSESFYVTEPVRPDRAPITTQVKALDLNMKTGEVSYETMDSSANITLKCRAL